MKSHSNGINLSELRRRTARRFLGGLALLAALAISMLAAPVTFADGGREIRLEDRCDPATFNAVLGAGACIGGGDVTFDQLLATLTPEIGGHHAWRFSREELGIKAGEVVRIKNAGGEVHSFSEVVDFGGGVVDVLNNALPPSERAPAQVIGDPRFLPAGGSLNIGNLSAGSHKFQCLIHPWMRSEIDVRSH